MAKSKAKILVVDDNNGIRAALGLLLPMHFAQVELIPSPKELVSRLADFPEKHLVAVMWGASLFFTRAF